MNNAPIANSLRFLRRGVTFSARSVPLRRAPSLAARRAGC